MLEALITKRRREFTVDVQLCLAAGEAVAIFGGSGEGKSTIHACLAGLEDPDAGEIRLGDRLLFPPPLPLHLRPIGLVTQRDNLFTHLDVARNIRLGLSKTQDPDLESWIGELRETLGLGPLW
ncbi:MAG: ATP-binding cassette domain-containing protein, partial [Cyanobacteria bacterium REEB65]|nr:ATP-binding cassette domain-containing protein [Cyanobacteria bacterium REEB65]